MAPTRVKALCLKSRFCQRNEENTSVPEEVVVDLDSDQDGLSDADEINIYGTNPLKSDTDGDGYLDGDEVKNGYNPLGEGSLSQ